MLTQDLVVHELLLIAQRARVIMGAFPPQSYAHGTAYTIACSVQFEIRFQMDPIMGPARREVLGSRVIDEEREHIEHLEREVFGMRPRI